MSSPIHTATCLASDARAVEIELGPTTAIGVHFPISEFLAVSLLHEAATGTVYRRPGVVWPVRNAAIAAATSFDELIDLAGIERPDPAKTTFAKRFVTRAAYVATRNFTPTLWPHDAARGFIDPGIDRRDPRAIAAGQAIDRAYEALDHDDDEASAPHATLRIEVTDPRWCAHLQPGMIWDVYAFDEGASLLW